MSTIKERLAAAKLPERSLQVCLRGDLAAEFDELERQLREARQTSPRRRVGSKADDTALAERIEALREQMASEMLTLRLRALPHAEWQELRRKHRDDEDKTNALGIKLEPFLSDVLPRSVVEPEMDADDWERLNEVLSAGDFDRLTLTVYDLNSSGVDVPKSRLASLVMAESGDASK